MDDVRRTLESVFQVVFDLPPDSDPTTVRQVTTAGWDSLGHVTLIAALESQFEIEIGAADSLGITSFEAAALIIEERLAGSV